MGIVWLLRPGLRAATPRYLNEVRFTPWLSLWRSSREILNHGFLGPLDLSHVGGLGVTKISRLQDVAYTLLRESSNPS
jgi:hypothetical protein